MKKLALLVICGLLLSCGQSAKEAKDNEEREATKKALKRLNLHAFWIHRQRTAKSNICTICAWHFMINQEESPIMSGVFTTIGTTFETAISGFTATTSSGVMTLITPLILTALVLYFTITGFMVMAGRISEPLSDLLIKGAKVALIAMVGLSTSDFMTYVAHAATGLEEDLLKAMGSPSSNIYELMDTSWTGGFDVIGLAFQEAGDLNILTEAGNMFVLLLAGLIGIIGLLSICAIGAGIVLMAKMALVVVLGFGPLFICALMFPVTANWFNSWLSAVMNYVFTSAIVAAFLMIFINIFSKYVSDLSLLFSNTEAEGFASEVLLYCVVILLTAIVSAYATLQVPNIAAALAGGVSVGATSFSSMLRSSYKTSTLGVGGASRAAGGVAPKSAQGAKGAQKTTSGASGVSSTPSSRRSNIANRYMKRNAIHKE